MREIFEKQEHMTFDDPRVQNCILLDTCFLIHTFEHQKDHQLRELMEKYTVAMTSFNVEEFLLKEHSVDERVREHARKFLKSNGLAIISIDVHPGNRDAEKSFVNSIDPNLLAEVPDASDAVLIAAAIKTSATVLTKDKHHLFTAVLENYLHKYNIEVFKEYSDMLK